MEALCNSSKAGGRLSESTDNEPMLYSPPMVAELLSLSISHVYLLLQRGDLPSKKIGRVTRVTRADLEEFISRMPDGQSGKYKGKPK
jgi:excisionase family DNA binding protein